MVRFVILYVVVAACISIVDAQSSCKTPSGDGLCKPLSECASLMTSEANNTTSEDKELLKSQCSSEGNTSKVCCPDPCYTPYGQPGKCVSIDTCQNLSDMLKPPVSKENMAYVHNSKCFGEDQNSVCCAPPRDSATYVQPGECKDKVSAFPPDPSSGCCGIDTVDPKMSSNKTKLHQHPWLVLIEHVQPLTTPNRLKCGGVLISGRYALTSAECVVGDILRWHGKPKRVRLGEFNTQYDGPDCIPPYPIAGVETHCTEGMVSIPIERTIPHPDYDPNIGQLQRRNAIALIRLKRMAPFTDFIRPICMPSADIALTLPDNVRLFVAGWGAEISNVKLQLDLPFLNMVECQKAYDVPNLETKIDLLSEYVCAGGEARRMNCISDVGSPLMHSQDGYYQVVGVYTFGPVKCSLKGIPSVFTKIFEYNTWIRSNIRP